ncbi:MAG TPA: GIY-YIG nuclease family protein [Aquabacterium sp.]|nr:GIY-YIG nuclease family protein [Aquabacterium sp.]
MGKSIRIYLADAEVGGIRHAEIVNWTGQALAFPRSKVADLKNWPEVRRQGVYFLIGTDEESGQEAVYIGEAEVVVERVAQHLSSKDFWSECVAFTSKDENLTKSHIKYLESRLVSSAIGAGRYLVKNSSTPQESGLPRADKDAMDEFSSSVRILLGVLGHRVLEPALSFTKPVATQVTKEGTGSSLTAPAASETQEPETFSLRVGNISAKAIRDTDALVVLAGSTVAKEIAPSLTNGYKAVRDKLLSSGVLSDTGEFYTFTKNYPFPSPSQAASVIVGYMMNGRYTWRTSDGCSLRDIEDAEAKALGEKLLNELSESNLDSPISLP